MEVLRCLQAENQQFEVLAAAEKISESGAEQLQLVQGAWHYEHQEPARGSYRPHASSLSREMEMLRCLQAENDHFDGSSPRQRERRLINCNW